MNDDIDLAAHQDDIGAEMNERENFLADWDQPNRQRWAKTDEAPIDMEPTEQALVGALLAQLGWTTDDLSTPDNVAVLVDDDREGLAKTVAQLDHVILLLATVRDEAAQTLAGLMEKDLELIAGMGVERSRTTRTEWDRDGAWRAVRFAIVERWAPLPGAPALVDRVLADVATAYSTTPKVTGLKALGIDANEYRATTRSERYTIKVTT
jgi:hypothetical protein